MQVRINSCPEHACASVYAGVGLDVSNDSKIFDAASFGAKVEQ